MKKHNILLIFVLVLCMRLFFYALFDSYTFAKQTTEDKKIASETIDPLNKIGRGFAGENFNEKKCKDGDKDSLEKENILAVSLSEELGLDDKKIGKLVSGYPIEKMIPYISQLDSKVASFLVAIAKKESDWGKHSPKKGGRNCFNYWGYKGSYKLTASGYSCFDSEEQAVKTVGGKIEELIGKKINTPERMVVWKCGSSCAGHNPEGVRKWISDVRNYFDKLNS